MAAIAKTAYPAEEQKWRVEEDERRLMSAAEVFNDRKRLKAALACMKEKQKAMSTMAAVLTRRK